MQLSATPSFLRIPIPEAPPVSTREVREFMAGDDPPVDADPAFKDRLREQLWEMIRTR